MNNHHSRKLNRILTKIGIMPYFFDEYGRKIYAPFSVKKTIYTALSKQINAASLPLPPVRVFYQNQPHFIRLHSANGTKWNGQWQLVLENQQVFTGKIKRNCLQFFHPLPLGYHQLTVKCGKRVMKSTIIIAPQCCYQPPALQEKKKLWGAFIQLYTLRTDTNWGIGDFADLQQFIRELAPYQADFLGLNPIHSLFPANPEAASPYSPSSRRWLNIAYICVEALPEFKQNSQAQQWFQSETVQQQLKKLRALDWVNYAEVISLKLQGLAFAFAQFQKNKDPEKLTAFEEFIQRGGESLWGQAIFDALHHHLRQHFNHQWEWGDWESDYQDFHSERVQQFCQQHQQEIEFYLWLQFIADQQLEACYLECQSEQMNIGLYQDLAVGVAKGGAETWTNKSLYCFGVSIGAPPDIMAPKGQNWGLVPFNPHILQQQGYCPFIELVRANMQHCGAIRIDHIMSLLRLWWVKQGDSAVNGVYVRYPVDDLIAILALESQRNQCLVIGEDLGTVPKEIVQKLHRARVLSYKIFYFEVDQDQSRALQNYPYQSMATLSTHDLPTINGYWKGYDFELGERFGIYPDTQVVNLLKYQRIQTKEKILRRLKEERVKIDEGINTSINSVITKDFNHNLQQYVAKVNSALFGLQPEDWLNMTEPVNIPGTSTQYPNWRRKLSNTIQEIFTDPDIQRLLSCVNKIRKETY